MKADVVVAAGESARACVDAVYRSAGAALGRVIAVCDEPADAAPLRELQGHRAETELVVLQNEARLGRIASWNRGLLLCGRDVLLLGSDIVLGERCLDEMLEVLHSSDRIASVAPLMTSAAVGVELAAVPRFTDVPTSSGSCLLVSHVVMNMIGGFDPAFDRADDAQDDWAMRAQRMGLRPVRANRAVAASEHRPRAEAEPAQTALLLARYPYLPEQANAALLGAEGRTPAHFVASKTGPLRVATTIPQNREPLEHFQVFYQSEPIDDAAQLLALLESPCHLVLGRADAYRSRALLFAAAHSAQAVVTASEQGRARLIEDLALDPSIVEVVESDAELTSLFRKVVDQPRDRSLRYRALLANFVRSLKAEANNLRVRAP